MAIGKIDKKFLLTQQTSTNPVDRALAPVGKVNEIIDAVNDLTDGSISTTDLTLTGDLVVGDDANITGTVTAADVDAGFITLDDGSVGALALRLGADTNNGLYGISDTQMGFAVEGALKGGVDTNGLFTDVISEQVVGNGVTVDGVLNKDGAITSTIPNKYSTEVGITAFAGGGQGSATQLTKEINQLGAVATTGDSVKLPSAEAGLTITVINSDVNAADVFPFTGDIIDSNGLNVAVSVLPGTVAVFTCISGNTWKSNMFQAQLQLLQVAAIYGLNTPTTKTPFISKGEFGSLSGPGAIPLTTYLTKITTTGADALTIANGAQDGQLKKIKMVVDGGDGTLTGTFNESSNTTITFADAGDYVILMWNGSDSWNVIDSGNDVDGITAPVVA